MESSGRGHRPGIYRILLPPDRLLHFQVDLSASNLGALMVCAGLGWVTYLSPPLAHYLSPYNLASGLLGEGSVCLWLLVMGVNVQRWKEQASAAGESYARSAQSSH